MVQHNGAYNGDAALNKTTGDAALNKTSTCASSAVCTVFACSMRFDCSMHCLRLQYALSRKNLRRQLRTAKQAKRKWRKFFSKRLWQILGGTIYNTHTLKPFKELGLDSRRGKKLASKLHVHSVNFAAKLVHTRRALSTTVINSHQKPVSGQACNPPDPHWCFLPFRGGGALRYSVPKLLLFLNYKPW